MHKKLRIAILGASGYTGAELLRLLLAHPHADIRMLTADSHAGKPMGAIYPHLGFAGLPDTIHLADADFSTIDLVFCCLPHGTAQDVVASLPDHVKVVDLSADFRLRDPHLYAQWYQHAHKAPHLQEQAVYGLSEPYRKAISTARLVANPGCYPTSAQLPLLPLLAEQLILPDRIIIDAKSGMTGAGRGASQALLFTEVDGGIDAYGVGAHRHAPEIEQGLSQAAGRPVTISFTPHHIPMSRGILSTLYVTLAPGKSLEDVRRCLHQAYEHEPFVKLLPPGAMPSTHMVRGTNLCVMAAFADRLEGGVILVSVIDNLVKGASGQAVQNMNILFGIEEITGLQQTALFP